MNLTQDYLMPTYKTWDITLSRAKGSYVFDTLGNKYLDLVNGISTTVLGHGYEEFNQAIISQINDLIHVSNLFGNEISPRVAVKLNELISGKSEEGKVFFANSGAEANECAIKLARRYSGNKTYKIICAKNGFHGRSLATVFATGQVEKQRGFGPVVTGFIHVDYNDVDQILRSIDDETAAVLLEPIQGEGGIIVPDAGYLKAVRKICDENNLLLILDEVQTGMGKTGKWFGFQHEDISPDIVTIAKALGNGVPVAACWAKSEVADLFSPGDHGTTFGGQPLAMKAAETTIEILEKIDAPNRAKKIEKAFKGGIKAGSKMKEIRGKGTLLAVEFSDNIAINVYERALKNSLLLNPVRKNTIRLLPSFMIKDEEIEAALELLNKSISEV
jgi:acetylornithine/N-succinyldiaminopimelate aminotransferase